MDLSKPGAFGTRKPFQCACCQNPWNIANNDESNNISNLPCRYENKGYTGIDPSNFDLSVNVQDNFYLWSNGGWMTANPIPKEYSSWNTFMVLRDMNLDRLKEILDGSESQEQVEVEVEDGGDKHDAEFEKVGVFYRLFMDEDTINSRGIASLMPILTRCHQFRGNDNLSALVAELHAHYNVRVLFNLYSSPDKKQSTHSLGCFAQGGLGMPDRDYYFDADKAGKREKYVAYIAEMLSLLGRHGGIAEYTDAVACGRAAADILAFETALAAAHMTRTDARNPEKTYNKMSIHQLGLLADAVTWQSYLARGSTHSALNMREYCANIGKPVEELGEVNVAHVHAVTTAAILATTRIQSIRHYFCFHVINSFASHLSNDFVSLNFDFFEKELKGTQEQRPRWKRALDFVEYALGDALGRKYVARYFGGDAKERALATVQQVKVCLRERLAELEWMQPETKQAALRKMEAFAVKIGYPDKWLDYSSMPASATDHIENVCNAGQFQFRLELSRMNAPTDRSRWFMTPQTVNAYYHPSMNEIVFPAAILQPPFFDPKADAAVNFGSLGAVVGHEMTHGFDDQGRKYDHEGNMRDWWTPADSAEYERRAAKMISQAGEFEVHGVKLNGKLTCGENIADLGGLKLAYRALMKQLADNGDAASPSLIINGFTPQQRFFLAWSQAWRGNITVERAKQLVTLDPHGPNELRCNGTLSNIDAFYEAFGITAEGKMYRSPEERVVIW